MSQVDFYVLNSEDDSRLRIFGCRIVEKAYKNGLRIYVRLPTERDAGTFDDLLWTFRQGSFVPHALVRDHLRQDEPVLIGTAVPETSQSWNVLINLTDSLVTSLEQFPRIVEIVDNMPARRRAARERFRFYRDKGFLLETRNVSEDGRVER